MFSKLKPYILIAETRGREGETKGWGSETVWGTKQYAVFQI